MIFFTENIRIWKCDITMTKQENTWSNSLSYSIHVKIHLLNCAIAYLGENLLSLRRVWDQRPRPLMYWQCHARSRMAQLLNSNAADSDASLFVSRQLKKIRWLWTVIGMRRIRRSICQVGKVAYESSGHIIYLWQSVGCALDFLPYNLTAKPP